MSTDNVIEIAVTASTEQLAAGMEKGSAIVQGETQKWQAAFAAMQSQMSAEINTLKAKIVELETQMTGSLRRVSSSAHEATGSIAIFGEMTGIHASRHVRSFIAQLPGVSEGLALAFNGVAIAGVIMLLVEAGKKIYEVMTAVATLSKAEQEHHDKVIKNAKEELSIAERRVKAEYALMIAQQTDPIEKQRLRVQMESALVGINETHLEQLLKEKKRLEDIVAIKEKDAASTEKFGQPGAKKDAGMMALPFRAFAAEAQRAEAKPIKKAADDMKKDIDAADDALKEAEAAVLDAQHGLGKMLEDKGVSRAEAQQQAAKVRADAQMELDKKTAEFRLMTGKSSLDEYSAALKAAADRDFITKRDALQHQIELDKKDPRAKDKVIVAQGELRALEIKHSAEMVDIDRRTLEMQTQDFIAAQRAKSASTQAGSREHVQIETDTFKWIAARYGEDSKTYQEALARKLAAEREYQRKKKELAQKDALDSISEAERVASDKLATLRKELDDEFQFGNVSRQKYLAAVDTLLQNEMKLRMTALQAKQKVLAQDPDMNAAALAQIQEQLKAVYAKYLNDRERAAEESRKRERADWRSHVKAIEGSFNSSLKGLISGTETFGQAWRNMANAIVSEAVDAFTKVLFKHIELAIFGDSFDKARLAEQQALAEANAAITEGVAIAAGAGQISVNAATAAAGAYSATAVIPFVGPELAPESAAVAYADVMAMNGLLAFRQGGIIPSDMLAMVHAKEMMLPAPLSEFVQDAAAKASGGDSGGGNSIYVSTVDARGFEKMLKRNGPSVKRATKEILRKAGVRT